MLYMGITMIYYIYRLVNTVDDEYYVGYSSQGLECRYSTHLSDANRFTTKLSSHMKKVGLENWNMELLEQLEADALEARIRTQHYIDMGATLNTNRAHSTKEDSKKRIIEWRARHKTTAAYRESRQRRFQCCGASILRTGKMRHMKTMKHRNSVLGPATVKYSIMEVNR